VSEVEVSVNAHFAAIVANGSLPRSSSFLEVLLSDDGTQFVENESYLFDYKRGWYKSAGDTGAPAILRALAGFHNTYGGILVVGVDNKTRVGGKNIVEVDIEAVNTFIRQGFSHSFVCSHRRYETSAGVVDCVLIPRREQGVRPVRIIQRVGDYPSGVVWKREAHEILQATPEDVVMLHSCRDFGQEHGAQLDSARTIIPPATATIQRFIGRQDALDDVFQWLGKPRSPRTFLWGKGGSGKSTIAYEVAVAASELGGDLKLGGRDSLDTVIYLSAKRRQLAPMYSKIEEISSPDFASRRELLEALLLLLDRSEGGISGMKDLSDDALIEHLEDAFDGKSALIVIDDIDTISTAETGETGSEDLFYILAKAKRISKIVYTQRDSPRFAGADVVEVKPLDNDEYKEFVTVCCDQFGVKLPDPEFIDGDLSTESERRPLIVEVVIGLARTCAGDFNKALELYKNRSGQDARRYLFEREYLYLASEADAQTVLYAIAVFNAPMTIDDLQVVTRWNPDRLHDAIEPVMNMFLELDEAGGGTRYRMSVPARDYILDVSKSVPRREHIEANIESHKAKRHLKGAAVTTLEASVQNLIEAGLATTAWQRVEAFSGTAKEMASPHFRMTRALANAHRERPDLSLVREDMSFAMDMRCATVDSLLTWIDLETHLMADMSGIQKITQYVENEKSIKLHEKAEVFVRRAKHSFKMGYELRDANHASASEAYIDAIKYNLWAQTIYNRLKSSKRAINHELVVKSTGAYISFAQFNKLWDNLPSDIRKLHDIRMCFVADSFSEPWLNIMANWSSGYRQIPLQSALDALDAFDAFILNPRRCYFESDQRESLVRDAIRSTRASLKKNASRLGQHRRIIK
jgi:hypothetical protein